MLQVCLRALIDTIEHPNQVRYPGQQIHMIVIGATDIQKRHQLYAEAMFKKDARINIRLPSKDLRGLQKKALAEGIPYQTLVASILHKYVEGRLHENSS